MFDQYALIEDRLRGIYHQLSKKILNHRSHAPKWKVESVEIEPGRPKEFVEDLEDLLALTQTIRALANHHESTEETAQKEFQIVPGFAPPNE